MMVDKKTSPDALTIDDLFRIADSHGLEPEEVVYNIQVTMDAFISQLQARKEEYHKFLEKKKEKDRELLQRIKDKKITTNLQNSQK
jgi:alanyl-tRNA synthetase